MMTNCHLNTTVIAIFPNVCLWRRSLCSDLVLTLENCIEPPSYARTAYVVVMMALISFRLFRKNLGNLKDFFGQMVYRPPWQKNFPYAYALWGGTYLYGYKGVTTSPFHFSN